MKRTQSSLLAATCLWALAQSASAVVLLTDNFTVTSNSQNVNQELSGRLGGTLAGSLIGSGNAYLLGGDHHQVGNVATFVGQPGGITDGNHVLVAFGGSFQCTVDIASTAIGPVTVGFDMYESSTSNAGGDATNWGSFTLRGAGGGNGFPIAGSGEFGMLRRTNGGIEAFQSGSAGITPGGYDVAGFTNTNNSYWQWTFTDTAGTGSAFNGNGSVAHWVNGPNSGSIALGQLSASGLFLGWSNANDRFVGIDNLSISTVPEPSSALLASLSLGLLAFRRRSRGH